ncbi:MAG: CvpA family protein [bacterium]|nr:CvpA family protein [bacterium]MCP4964384.1 CvpA family protein [bacterium]
MLDLVLGVLLVVLAIRGWMRGLVKEVISLAVLVVGTLAAFRLSTPLGSVLASMSGASPVASRYVAGIMIFFGMTIAAAVVSRALHLGMRILPGVSTLNRAAGAALSLLALALVVTVAVSIASVSPLPEAAAEELEGSDVAATIVDPDGVPQRVLGFLSGDRVVEVSLRIRSLTGGQTAVATVDAPLELVAAESGDLERLPDTEVVMVDLMNHERVAEDVDPVLRSAGLDQVAFDLVRDAYVSGRAQVLTNDLLRSHLNDLGMPSTQHTQLMVLAASPEAAHAALVAEVGTEMLGPGFVKAGIAVVQGPVGLLIVTILTG